MLNTRTFFSQKRIQGCFRLDIYLISSYIYILKKITTSCNLPAILYTIQCQPEWGSLLVQLDQNQSGCQAKPNARRFSYGNGGENKAFWEGSCRGVTVNPVIMGEMSSSTSRVKVFIHWIFSDFGFQFFCCCFETTWNNFHFWRFDTERISKRLLTPLVCDRPVAL